MTYEPKTSDQHFRAKWRQLRFLIGIQRDRCSAVGKMYVIDSAMAEHVYALATHEAIIHAMPYHGDTQVEEFRNRYNEVLDYFAPADTTITRLGLPLRRA